MRNWSLERFCAILSFQFVFKESVRTFQTASKHLNILIFRVWGLNLSLKMPYQEAIETVETEKKLDSQYKLEKTKQTEVLPTT